MFIDEELKIQILSKIFMNHVEIKKSLALYITLSSAQLQNLRFGEKLVGIIRLDSGCIRNIAYETKYFI